MVSLHYRVSGSEYDGIPVFVLHTIPLDHVYLYDSFHEMDPKVPFYFVDLPNHGKSEDLEEKNLDFNQMAQEINSLREQLDFERIHILGHGIGGFVAQHYAVNFPENLGSLILVNSAGDKKYRDDMAWNIRDRYSKVTKQALDQHYGETDSKSIRVRFTQSFAVYFDPTDHDAAKQLMDSTNRFATDAYVHLSKSIIPQHQMREQLRSVDAPTLLIACRKDVWPLDPIKKMQSDIDHAKVKYFDTGHFPMIENPSKFWTLIQDFALSAT